MKSLKDIFSPLKNDSIDVRDVDRNKEICVEKENNSFFVDLSPTEYQDPIIRGEKNIKLSKKIGINFDALEKTIKKKKKDIRIGRKTGGMNIQASIIVLMRRLRNISLRGGIYLGLIACSLTIFLGYVDKLVVENRVNAGYEKLLSLKSGGKSIDDIKKTINNARFDFLTADSLFIPFRIIPNEKIDSISHVISGGRHLTKSLDDVLSLYTQTQKYINEKSIQSIYFTHLLDEVKPNLLGIEASLSESLSHYKNVSWLPSYDLHRQKNEQIENIEQVLHYISVINKDFENIKDVLGHNERKKYLIVFQNADEIRPTGGFMGSMGLLEIFRGRVQLFQKKDVYAIEWDLKSADYERLEAPKGINTLTDTFGLRDANYFVNIEDSSNTINFFTERAGLDLDGIIYINHGSLLRMLDMTGPIFSETLGREISSDNFSEIMSLVVEAKIFKQGTLGTPKQALFDFMEEYSNKLGDEGNYFDYIKVLLHEVQAREIMFWSFDNRGRKVLEDIGLTGDINYDTTLDFAYPVYTSISGNKSDRYMKRLYSQRVEKGESCSYDVEFTIKSTHDMGQLKRDRVQGLIEEFSLDSPNLFEIQGASPNKQYVRVILPHDAEIQNQQGMEIVDYGARKGVEFFLNTELQQSSFYTVSYSLPNPNCRDYSYILYKQPGIRYFDVSLNISGEVFDYQGREEDFYFEER